jgi:hypothetical protein
MAGRFPACGFGLAPDSSCPEALPKKKQIPGKVDQAAFENSHHHHEKADPGLPGLGKKTKAPGKFIKTAVPGKTQRQSNKREGGTGKTEDTIRPVPGVRQKQGGTEKIDRDDKSQNTVSLDEKISRPFKTAPHIKKRGGYGKEEYYRHDRQYQGAQNGGQTGLIPGVMKKTLQPHRKATSGKKSP